MKFGAIDVGTNAARLLIGEVAENNGIPFINKVSYTRIPLRLGMDVFERGVISDHKIIEFRKTIQAFKLIAEVFNVVDLRACATSAMREASNGMEVQHYINKMTNVDIEIIDGDEEASLILSNFLFGNQEVKDDFIVIDVGGGSTEISVFKKGELTASKSFGLGTIRIMKEKAPVDVWEKSREWVMKKTKSGKAVKVFATGGNINKAHKMLGKKSQETIGIKEFRELAIKLRAMTPKERINEFKLKTDRADVIATACDIYLHLFEAIGCDEIAVPKIGLSDGIIHNLHRKHQIAAS